MIEVQKVSKEFRTGSLWRPQSVTALSEISFSIRTGESVAFLGPNGAGKSTLIRVLSGILKPTSGTSSICGFPSGSRAACQRLGLIMGTRSQLWMHMTVRENLGILAEVYGLTSKSRDENIAMLEHALALGEVIDRRVRSLSLGQRMRGELAASLIHLPDVLLLDEPTIGLDVVSKLLFRDLLHKWCRERQTTILLTSHDSADVEAIGKRVILISRGGLAFDGTPDELRKAVNPMRYVKVITNNDIERKVYEFNPQTQPIGDFLQEIIRRHGSELLDLEIVEMPLEETLRKHFSGALA